MPVNQNSGIHYQIPVRHLTSAKSYPLVSYPGTSYMLTDCFWVRHQAEGAISSVHEFSQNTKKLNSRVCPTPTCPSVADSPYLAYKRHSYHPLAPKRGCSLLKHFLNGFAQWIQCYKTSRGGRERETFCLTSPQLHTVITFLPSLLIHFYS